MQAVTDPEQLLAVKRELEALWSQLPAEHRATMALVLLGTVKDSEWGAWFRGVIETQWPHDAKTSAVSFPVLSISAASLKRAGLSDEQVARLGSKGLELVAEETCAAFDMDHGFWFSLGETARRILDEDMG